MLRSRPPGQDCGRWTTFWIRRGVALLALCGSVRVALRWLWAALTRHSAHSFALLVHFVLTPLRCGSADGRGDRQARFLAQRNRAEFDPGVNSMNLLDLVFQDGCELATNRPPTSRTPPQTPPPGHFATATAKPGCLDKRATRQGHTPVLYLRCYGVDRQVMAW
jgi:hypothetical protein